jgi:hypothetical protein
MDKVQKTFGSQYFLCLYNYTGCACYQGHGYSNFTAYKYCTRLDILWQLTFSRVLLRSVFLGEVWLYKFSLRIFTDFVLVNYKIWTLFLYKKDLTLFQAETNFGSCLPSF